MTKQNRLIRHINKKTGVTYLYWGHSIYVPGQKYSKVEKKCIGKIDSRGKFEPNKTILALSPEKQISTGLVGDASLVPYTKGEISVYETKMYGFIALLETAAKETGAWQSLYRPKHFHHVCWHTLVDHPSENGITKVVPPSSL